MVVDLKNYTIYFMTHQRVSEIIGMSFDSVKQAQKNSFEIWKKKFSFFGDLQFLGLQKVGLKSTEIHGAIFFMESKHISIFDVNISSYEHVQVSLQILDKIVKT